ncbi:MAG: Spy/CpxP family protein refolding chaperone [Pseudolabrys sp.]
MKARLAVITALAFGSLTIMTASLFAQPAGQGPGAGPPAAGGQGPGPGPGYGPRGGGWGPGMMMGPGMMGMSGFGGMCNPRSAGLAEWRMQRIEQIVKPTDAQKAALTALRDASTKAAESIAAACPTEFPDSAPARLELMEKRMEAMLAAVKTVRPAFDTFYATLSEEQKARMNTAGPRGWGWRGWR